MSETREPVVLAIDAGTGSARAIAFDGAGRIVAAASREWTHAATPGYPGGTDFDTSNGWRLISAAIAEVVETLDGRPIVAVGASSMREGFVLYDKRGAEIFACPNTDGRAQSQAEALVRNGVADRIYEVGGDWVSITAPGRLLWLSQEQPDVLGAARHLGMLSDWVTYRLTGEFTTDPTCGSSSALFDLATRQWSPELSELVGLSSAVLPDVVESGTVVGRVTAAAAAETRLPAGVPVVVGGADTQLALHSMGASSRRPTVVAGTFWQTTAVASHPVIDPKRRLRTLCHVEPGTWMVEGIGFLSGLAMRWFRDGFWPDAVAADRDGGPAAFTAMEQEAADVPRGSNGVVAVLANVMQTDAWHHSAPGFVNFDINDSRRHHRGTFVRAIEEAAAYVTRAHLEVLEDLLGPDTIGRGEITLAGGTSAAALWPSIIAEVTAAAVHRTVVSEATSHGVARLAAQSVGVSMPPANGSHGTVRPDPAAVAQYEDHYRRWFDVYRAQVEATHASGLTPLFRPPGGLDYHPARPHTNANPKQKEIING